MSVQTLHERLIRKRRPVLALYLALALLAVQITGMHFHVDRSVDLHESTAVTSAHAEHSDSHTAHHENTGGIHLAKAEFWKNPEQGWSVFVLFAAVSVLLLFGCRRVAPDRTFTEKLPHSQPAFLRPSLRAPPR